jgi:hypothetical protein
MPTCIFAAQAGPSEAELGGVMKANFLVRSSAAPTTDPTLKRKSPRTNRLCRTESRAWADMLSDSHPSWRPPAMGVLSVIHGPDGATLAYENR